MKKITKPKSFIVRRRSWWRGKGFANSELRRFDGMKCCLGFYAIACGVPARMLTGEVVPADLLSKDIRLPELITQAGVHSAQCTLMMSVNDDGALPDRERESKLRKLFKLIGVKVRFK